VPEPRLAARAVVSEVGAKPRIAHLEGAHEVAVYSVEPRDLARLVGQVKRISV
jgi:hypothetical protein